jgi:hypothetical protein
MRYVTANFTVVLLTGYLAVSTVSSQGPPDQNSAKPFFEPFGLDLSAIDKHTRPQDDFYQYVNGAWIARTTIPADKDQVEVDDFTQDRIDAQIRGLLEEAANDDQTIARHCVHLSFPCTGSVCAKFSIEYFSTC